jgi:hypothetical protein
MDKLSHGLSDWNRQWAHHLGHDLFRPSTDASAHPSTTITWATSPEHTKLENWMITPISSFSH